YRLVERLGRGGMGGGGRPAHPPRAPEAAGKLLRPGALRGPPPAPEGRARVPPAAHTPAPRRPRPTRQLFAPGRRDDATRFYVRELFDGDDLDKLVKLHGPVPAARVIHLLAQASQSLSEAHDAGLLHRDIKPANLFVCRAADEVDVLKVLDFGIVHTSAEPVD